jgi:hypothetical protein
MKQTERALLGFLVFRCPARSKSDRKRVTLSNYLKTCGSADGRSRLSHLWRRSGGTTSPSTRADPRAEAESGRLTRACTLIYAEAGGVREGETG